MSSYIGVLPLHYPLVQSSAASPPAIKRVTTQIKMISGSLYVLLADFVRRMMVVVGGTIFELTHEVLV